MNIRICQFNPNNNRITQVIIVDRIYREAMEYVKELNEKLNKKPNKKELYWTITEINI